MLPKKIRSNESVVINIQDFLDGTGTHWVCIVNQPDSENVEYFDSFGVRPSDVVVEYMSGKKDGVYSDTHIQDVDSVTCGYYVCYFIIERSKGRSMLDILLDFSEPEINEQLISRFAAGLHRGASLRTPMHGGGGVPTWKDQLADELHKPVRRKFRRRRVEVKRIDQIWSADLVDMQWNSRQNSGYKYLLNIIDLFSKYAWSVPTKDKTGRSITDAFDKVVKSSGRKPEKLWVDQGTEFYNRVFRSWLKENDIEMYSTHNDGKAVVVERFNRTIKEKMWKYFSANNTHKYIDILDSLMDLYNSGYHRSIKMSPKEASLVENETEVRRNLYRSVDKSTKPAKFKEGDTVRISVKKSIFEKGYTPRWTEEVFRVVEVQVTTPVTYKLEDLNEEKIDGSFYDAELQKTEQGVFRVEKVLRRDKKNGMVLVKWRGYGPAFNSWIPTGNIENLKP